MRKERERGTDKADDACADESVLNRFSSIGILRRDEPDNHLRRRSCWRSLRGGRCVGAARLGRHWVRQVQVNAKHVGVMETEAYASRIPGRIAEQVSLCHPGEEAVDGRAIGVVDDDGLTVDQALQAAPCGIGEAHGCWVVGQRLPRSAGDEGEGEQENRKFFHEQ